MGKSIGITAGNGSCELRDGAKHDKPDQENDISISWEGKIRGLAQKGLYIYPKKNMLIGGK
jgi:hypothetical protein